MPPQSSKPEPDVYVGLLFVSVAALIAGCAMLAYMLQQYEWTLPV